jgi:hypothetical protein
VIDQFHASRGFVLELMVVVILVIELASAEPWGAAVAPSLRG